MKQKQIFMSTKFFTSVTWAQLTKCELKYTKCMSKNVEIFLFMKVLFITILNEEMLRSYYKIKSKLLLVKSLILNTIKQFFSFFILELNSELDAHRKQLQRKNPNFT